MKRSYWKRGMQYLKKNSIKALWTKAAERLLRDREEREYDSWLKNHLPSAQELALQREKEWKNSPKFSLIVPAYQTSELFFRQMIESVRKQTYENWELCIADGTEGDRNIFAEMPEEIREDQRIFYRKTGVNRGIAGNTNEALSMASGDYIVLLDHDDLLTENALFEAASVIERHQETEILYSDEDKVNAELTHYFCPHFKPDFNLELLRTNNYICHLFFVKKQVAEKAGIFSEEYNGAQDYDFILRCVEQSGSVYHIPRILYHWRSHEASTAANPESKRYAYEAGKRALEAHLKRCGLEAGVENTRDPGFYKTKYQSRLNGRVLAVIYGIREEETRKRCEKAFEYCGYPSENIEFLWINRTNLEKKPEFTNRQKKQDMLLFLNAEIVMQSKDWLLELMTGWQKDTGAVGCKLCSKNGRICQAGIAFSRNGKAGYLFYGMKQSYSGYFHKADLRQQVNAVSGCLLTTAALAEKEFIWNGDWEASQLLYCIQLEKIGKKVIYHPDSVGKIMGQKKENPVISLKEVENIVKFYYNPNLEEKKFQYGLKWDGEER